MRHYTELNRKQQDDIELMKRNIPAWHSGQQATKGWAFCHPPEVEWPGVGTVNSEAFKELLVDHYMDFRWETNTRRIEYGIMPWTVKTLKDGRRIPVIPPIGTGTIKQYYDFEEKEWVYHWFWRDSPTPGEPDLDVYFKVWHKPDIYGNYTSPAASALRAWKLALEASLAGERAMYHGSRMPYFLVHAPPKGRPGDEKFKMNFADEEDLEMERDAHNRELEKGVMSRNAVRAAVAESIAQNRGGSSRQITESRFKTPIINSESYMEAEEREGDGVLDRLVYLDDHWNIANAQPPVLLINPLDYEKRLEQIAASLVDFPLSMVIEQHAQHAGNFDAQITFARDRMKWIILDMNRFLEQVIVKVHEKELRKLYVNAAKSEILRQNKPLPAAELKGIHRAFHRPKVSQKCTPLMTFEQAKAIWESGLVSQETFAKHASHIHGFDEEEIEITQLKRPAEIELAQLEMSQQQATHQRGLEDKRLKLEAKKTDADIENQKKQAAAPKPSAGGGGASSSNKKK